MKSVQQIIDLCETPIYKEFATWAKVVDENKMWDRKTTQAQLAKYDAAKADWHLLTLVAGQLKTAANL